jgi:hypothetical protein
MKNQFVLDKKRFIIKIGKFLEEKTTQDSGAPFSDWSFLYLTFVCFIQLLVLLSIFKAKNRINNISWKIQVQLTKKLLHQLMNEI